MPRSTSIVSRQVRGGSIDPVAIVRDDAWAVTLYPEEVIGGADKTITVPPGYLWQVLWIWIELATTVVAGNRQLQIDFRDGADDIIGQIRPNAIQTALLTRNYMIGSALANQTAFYDTDYIQTPMPPTIFLPEGFDIRIHDNNNTSENDVMILQVMVASKVI